MPHFVPHFFPRRRDAKHYVRETENPLIMQVFGISIKLDYMGII